MTAQHANVQAILRGYEALNRGDFEAAGKHLSPDFEFTLPPMLPDYDRSATGPDSFVRFWRAWSDQFENFRIEIEEVLDAGEGRVLVMAGVHGIGKGSGAEVRTPAFGQIWTLEHERATSMTSVPNRAAAMGELGLGPKVDWE